MESFILDQEDLDNPVLKTASELLLSSAADGADLRTVDPETQARLEALLEAAGTFPLRARSLSLSFARLFDSSADSSHMPACLYSPACLVIFKAN